MHPIFKFIIKIMKYILILIIPLLSLLLTNVQAQTDVPVSATSTAINPNAPLVKWDKTENDFGQIAQNVPKTAEFTLTNNGKEPLVIQSAKASCGCTDLKYSKKPILPGKTSVISVTYNAAAPGSFIKTITVITNADPNPVVLQIKGTVDPEIKAPK